MPVLTLADDAKVLLLTVINNAANSIKADSSTANVAAQGAVALASLIPLLPKLENDAIIQIATAAQLAAQNALTPATAATPVA